MEKHNEKLKKSFCWISFFSSITDYAKMSIHKLMNTTLFIGIFQTSLFGCSWFPSTSDLKKFNSMSTQSFLHSIKLSAMLIFFFQKKFDCPLADLFNASFISLEEPEPILCGNWNFYHGTLTPEIIVWSVSVWRVGNLVTLDSCLMWIPHRLAER